MSVENADLWAQQKVVVAGASATTASIEVRAAGTIAGSVRAPQGQSLPASLNLRFRSAPGAKPPLDEVSTTCPIAEGRFRCTVPAGSLDLRLRARGFLTHYRWGASVPKRKTLALGTLDLKPGAEVVGWIEAPDRDFRFSQVSVELAPQAMGMAGDPARNAALVQKETVNSRGFFEITGIAPGGYRLVVRHPRFATKEVAPILVGAGTETELHPLRLEPPVSFETRIDPPIDPYGQRWSVELDFASDVAGVPSQVKQGPADASGTFRASGLEPGRYLLRVEGSHRARWVQEEIEIDAASTQHDIHLPLVQVQGEVRMGGKPLYALLWFGGHQAAQRMAAKSDAEGRFSVILPEQEHWRVEVYNTQLHVDGVLPSVPVHRAPGESVARVSLDLPDTSVRGQVVDEQERPIAGARVETNGPAGDPVLSDEQGRFELLGMPPGDWTLQAVGEDRLSSSEVVSFHLDEKAPAEGIKLVVRKELRLAGMVVGPDGGGVPGAQIEGEIDDPTLSMVQPQAVSDMSGQFELYVPARTDGLRLTVLPPGFAVTQQHIQAQHPDPLLLQVTPLGGTLTLLYDGGASLAKTTRVFLTSLSHDFIFPSTQTLARWAEANGASTDDPTRLSIPMLEPGPYTACFPEDAPLADDGSLKPGLQGRCVSGTLGALGELVLKLEVKAPAEGKRAAAEGAKAPATP